MLFRTVYDPYLAQAAYLIGCQQTGEAIVIDPERDIDRYLALAARENLRIVAATETHIHADFLSGARELAEQAGVRLFLSDEGPADWKYGWLDSPQSVSSYDAQLLHHGDRFSIGNIEFEVVYTPGHTPEHISFLVTDRGGGASEPMGIVTGDFVFVGDLGRPDLLESAAGIKGTKVPGARALAESARGFLGLEDYLQVWPGHGAGSACGKTLGAVPQTTVGYERRFNPALTLADREDDFVEFILAGQPSTPLYFARMKKENRDGPPLLETLPAPRHVPADEVALDHVILDTRSSSLFSAAHIRGSLSAPAGPSLPGMAGSYLSPGDTIHLVADADRVDEIARVLVRIGLDHVATWTEAAQLDRAGDPVALPGIDASELRDRLARQPFVLDVRSADEHAAGAIAGALNIPHTRLLEAIETLPRNEPLLVHCRGGERSIAATALLRRHGFDAVDVRGGIEAWIAGGHPVARPSSLTGSRPA